LKKEKQMMMKWRKTLLTVRCVAGMIEKTECCYVMAAIKVITWNVLLRLLRMFPSMSGIALPVPPEYSPTSTVRNSYMRDTPRRVSEMYHTCGLRVGDHVEVLLDAFLLWDEQALPKGLEQLPLHEDEAELNVDGDGEEDGERVALEGGAEGGHGLAQEVKKGQQGKKGDEERHHGQVKRRRVVHV